jgi:hypothetical protein
VTDVPPPSDEISAEPTKAFFIDMFTRDIPLEQAVLDLVDNSVDGAKRSPKDTDEPYDGKYVDITFNRNEFRILDNCGGFSKDVARDYAFRFGRPAGTPQTPNSIGQFGVGMKRALFKFGRHFLVHSATADEEWAVDVNVTEWQSEPGWHFPWADPPTDSKVSLLKPGTETVVTNLRYEVSSTFGTKNFENTIIGLIKSKHRLFLSKGLDITVNGTRLDPLMLAVHHDNGLHPAVELWMIEDEGLAPVDVRIVVGVGPSTPRLAGWYVICNGRIILEADRRDVTGWGALEDASGKALIPGFHNQFARFRGVASFESTDSSRIPWNTTKTDVDQDSPVWRTARERMIELMRPVIDFLNELDADIDEYTREKSPLYHFVEAAATVRPEFLAQRMEFEAPERQDLGAVIRTVKIQYSREWDDVEFMQRMLGVKSAKAVGERTFDMALQRQRGR